ncbi:MAG: hypothetical protein Q9225_002524 [Loekoesia sp. 1 TL-2023]
MATLNITTNSTEKVFDAIEQATGKPFNDTVIGTVTNLTYQVEPGAMGYYGFTETLNCFAGTLGDCIGGDVMPGTAVEACEPKTLDGTDTSGYLTLDGTGAFVRTDDISNMETNPSAMRPNGSTDSTSGNAGNTVTHPTNTHAPILRCLSLYNDGFLDLKRNMIVVTMEDIRQRMSGFINAS